MRTIESIERDIEALKLKLENAEGTQTEVYTRIVGYYRSVRNWNKGKKEEYTQRVCFSQPNIEQAAESSGQESPAETVPAASVGTREPAGAAAPSHYLYFYRTACPKCPPVLAALEETDLSGRKINADTREGLKEAQKWSVMASPTVIFLDGQGNEVLRARDVSEVKDFTQAAVAV